MIAIKQVEFEEIKDKWIRLENEGDVPVIYQTYDWQRIWWQHYGYSRRNLLLLGAYCKNDLVGIAPLFIDSLVIKKRVKLFDMINLVGARESDYTGLIFRQEFYPQVFESFAFYLSRHYPHCILYFTDLQEELFKKIKPFAHYYPGFISRKDFLCPMVDCSSSWEDYKSRLGKSTKKLLNRQRNKLNKTGQLKIEMITSYSEGDSNDLFKLHYQRWSMNPDEPSLSRLERFEKDIMKMLACKKYLRLMFLNHDGKRIAGLFMYDYHNIRHFHKGGYSPDYSDLSPGTVLLAEAIKCAFESNINYFDLLRGEENYKSHFTKDRLQCYSLIAARTYMRAKLFEIILKL
jgi:CelD/BcsL family acetyltransferase involved in cellulose biosynthesis